MGKSKRRFTQYALNIPTALRGHLPNLDLYSVEHRSLDTLRLEPEVCSMQQRNVRTIQRLQSVWNTCRQRSIQLVA